MRARHLPPLLLVSTLALTLSACSVDVDEETQQEICTELQLDDGLCNNDGDPVDPVDPVVELQPYNLQPVASRTALQQRMAAGRSALANGQLESQLRMGAPLLDVDLPVAGGDGAGAPTAPGAPEAEPNRTNVQVAGVDEADIIKSSGDQLYVAEFEYSYEVMPAAASDELVSGAPMPQPPAVKAQVSRYLLDYRDGSHTVLPPLVFDGEDLTNLSGLKLHLTGGEQPRLAVLGEANSWGWMSWFGESYQQANPQTRLWLYDISNVSQIPQPDEIRFDGALIASRRIGDQLYLISRYYPGSSDADLLPEWQFNGSSSAMVEANDCYVAAASAQDYPALTVITRVDLTAPAQPQSSCYAGDAYTLYMSADALYLASVRSNAAFNWDAPVALEQPLASGDASAAVVEALEQGVAPVETLIHKFALTDSGVEYRASGLVAGGFTGWIGTGHQPQWRFHEQDGRLNLITSWWNGNGELRHQFYVLAEQQQELAVVATLPNASQPQAIGKPGEDLMAARYVDDRAYLVTFRQIDPLYVLDLSQPLQPKVAGSLEIPGFSAYLHPLNEDLLLGIGPDGSSGFEASLFDVSNAAQPQRIAQAGLCQSCSMPLSYDYHAISYGAGVDDWSIALPYSRYGDDSNGWLNQAAVARLRVDLDRRLLQLQSPLLAEQGSVALDRALRVGNSLYQVLRGDLNGMHWPAGIDQEPLSPTDKAGALDLGGRLLGNVDLASGYNFPRLPVQLNALPLSQLQPGDLLSLWSPLSASKHYFRVREDLGYSSAADSRAFVLKTVGEPEHATDASILQLEGQSDLLSSFDLHMGGQSYTLVPAATGGYVLNDQRNIYCGDDEGQQPCKPDLLLQP